MIEFPPGFRAARRRALLLAGALAAGVSLAAPAEAGRIVVNHDTATLNTPSPGVARFSQNLVRFLDGDAPGGSVLVFNRNDSLGGLERLEDLFFVQAVTAIGYTVTIADPNAGLTAATLAAHDAVLLAGPLRDSAGRDIKDDAVLADYVAQGGGLYIAAGTGRFGPAAAEAAYWNSLLAGFGLAFQPEVNNRFGPISGGTGLLFEGVGPLNAGNGQDIVLTGSNSNAAIVQFAPGSATLGLTAAFAGPHAVAVSEPRGLALFGLALSLVGLAARRRSGQG